MDPFNSDLGILNETSEELMLKKLLQFYKIPKNFGLFSELMHQKYAKRVIEWFVTVYSREQGLRITRGLKLVDIYQDYKKQLKIHSKIYFDPFRRNSKFQFPGPNGQSVTTTIGQLNFFKWLIETKLANYILDPIYYQQIKTHMKLTLNTPKKK